MRRRSTRVEGLKVARFLEPLHLVPFDADAAREAARVRALLESAGQTIGPCDLLLAGQALAMDVVSVTRNSREFQRVPGCSWKIGSPGAAHHDRRRTHPSNFRGRLGVCCFRTALNP